MKGLLVLIFIGIAYGSVIPNSLSDYSQQYVRPDNFAELVSESAKESMVEMVTGEGYPIESHYVTTSDGYILNVFRIPHGKTGQKNDKVAFLMHGVLSSSIDWVVIGSEKALAYKLADEGYDVWIGNARGNSLSRNHTSLDPELDKAQFWKFDWHEIGTTDIPAMIDYVLEQTGVEGIYYAGHSQGTTSFYVMTSMRPEYNDKIITQVSLAPIAFMNHMTSPLLKLISVFEGTVSALLALLGVDEFLPSESLLGTVIADICEGSVGEVLCENTLFILCGFSEDEMNTTLLPTIMSHVPAGASTRQMLHYAQEINSGHFRQYDLGLIENELTYGSLAPPDYDLSKITAPVHMLYSDNDWLASTVDVDRLCTALPNCVEKLEITHKNFNHLDYLYAIDAPTLVNDRVIEIFKKY
ncbi:hypothetical protein NQ318_013446 [Aromia moschata]|uniref:Lipase n=1 Tax=Aromia moschata TaxID=1265417 RepID=A0AAV8YQ79_9CUCU|nr:hypothetical protein NQ318_013446 [Aromia moschata]